MGLGVVARNHEGVIVATVCRSPSHISDLSTTEGMAARIDVELSNSLGLRDIILEGDALEVVQALNQSDMCCRSYGQIINDSKFLMSCGSSWIVKHIWRTANGVAHQIAKLGLEQNEEQIWRMTFPGSVTDIAVADLAHVGRSYLKGVFLFSKHDHICDVCCF